MIYKINIQNTIEKLILLVLVLTPIFSFQESISLIFGGLINNSTALTSPYIKGIKDMAFVIIILFSSLLIVRKYKINKILLISIFLTFIFVLLPAYYYHNNIIIYLSGVRWLMPFVLAFFLIGHISEKLLFKIGIVLYYLFILHFTLQLIQLIFAEGWFGKNSLGLSLRNPGIFFIPSTAAIFSILVLFFSKFYMDKKRERRLFFLIPISIFFTASGTGVVTFIVFILLYYLKKKLIPLSPFVIMLLSIVLIFSLDFFTGRTGIVEESFGTRIEIFKNNLYNSSYLPTNFGYGTATGYLIENKFGLTFNMVATDSWFASVLVNLGLINSLIIISLLLLYFLILIFIFKDKEKLIFLTMYTLFSLTTVITESFPANLIFAVLLAYYIKPKNCKTYEYRKNLFK